MNDSRADDEGKAGHDGKGGRHGRSDQKFHHGSHSAESQHDEFTIVGRVETLESRLTPEVSPISTVLRMKLFALLENEGVDASVVVDVEWSRVVYKKILLWWHEMSLIIEHPLVRLVMTLENERDIRRVTKVLRFQKGSVEAVRQSEGCLVVGDFQKICAKHHQHRVAVWPG